MCRTLIGAILILVSTGQAQEREDMDVGLRQWVCATLSQRLEGMNQVYSNEILEELTQKSGLEEPELRKQLLVLLGNMDQQRQEKSTGWKALVALDGEGMETRQVSRFMQELCSIARKMVEKKGNYDIGQVVDRAAGKAKLLPYRGKDLLLKILQAGAGMDVVQVIGLPEKIGVWVKGDSHYRITQERFPGLLSTVEGRLYMEEGHGYPHSYCFHSDPRTALL